MTIQPPVIDGRSEAEVLKALDDRAPGFTPEWKPGSGTSDKALAHIFARYSGIFLEGLRETPHRGFLAFLDMLGANLLAAEPARAPLVFTLLDNATTDPSVVANSQVAAPAQPPAPSPLLGSETPSAKSEAAVFATEKEITLARAKLAALYSIDPGSDDFADHSARLTAGFTLFGDMQQVEHALYLGHDRLFALAANAEVRLSIQFAPLSTDPNHSRPLDIGWEYFSKDGWLPLIVEKATSDTTNHFTQSGQIVLHKSCGPDAKEQTFNGQTSYWIRGKLGNLLPPESGDENAGPVPVVDTIRARVSFIKGDLLAEAAGTDGFTLDLSTNFFPFGKQPERYTTFYLASKEVFQRKGARVRIDIALSRPASAKAETNLTNATAKLVWEYFDGNNWRSIQNFQFQDGTKDFKEFNLIGAVSFLCPTDWAETSVNGTKNYWLRARIDSGDYGHPLQLKITGTGASTKVDADESTLEPPVIQSLKLQYSYQTDSEMLDHCLSFNDFVYTDHTHECQWPRLTFEPFLPVREPQPAVYFGFSQALPAGLVSIFLQTPPAAAEQGGSETPSFVWEYRNDTGWSELGVLDETVGFQRRGMIQFIGEPDAVAVPGLGGSLFRVRARLKVGERLTPAAVNGIWMNAVWATHSEIVKREEIGVSDGNPSQTFYLRPRTAIDTGTESLRGTPMIEGRAIQLPPQAVQIPGDPADQQTLEVPSGTIEVREWSGHGRDWENAIQDISLERRRDEVRLEYDPTSRTVKEVWVRWQSKPHLFKSLPTDRHSVMERALGSIRFGDGIHGRIPTSGSRIVATYATGGGLEGNVAAGKITELRSAVPFLKSVSNPIPASGGAATEALAAVMFRGAESFRNGGRAISPRDIEWVARDASPGVARAHCLPVTGPIGRVQRGWFTVAVLPLTDEAQPNPSPELRRVVREHLAAYVPAAVSGRIRVIAPSYVPVGVLAEVVAVEPETTAQIEARILKRLGDFLHPLRGGSDGRGWPFGQPLHYSQIARLLEQTPGVDYVITITLRMGSELFDEMVPVPPDSLIASGDHELKMTLGEP